MGDEFPETDLDTPTEHDIDEAYGSRFLGVVDVGDKKIRTKIRMRKEEVKDRDTGKSRKDHRLFRKHRQAFGPERHQQKYTRRRFRKSAGRLA